MPILLEGIGLLVAVYVFARGLLAIYHDITARKAVPLSKGNIETGAAGPGVSANATAPSHKESQ